MKKPIYLFVLSILFLPSHGQVVSNVDFTLSGKGFIFTIVKINGIKAKAMIDFGDPHVLQVSTTFIEANNLEVQMTEHKTSDVFGNMFDISEGTAETLGVSGITLENIVFQSGKHELEHVSKEVGVKFHAVLGWGFFREYQLKVDYDEKQITLFKSLPDIPPHFSTVQYAKEGHIIVKTRIDTVKAQLILDTGAPFNILDSTWYHQRKAQITSFQSKKRYKVIFNLKLKNIETDIGNGHPNVAYLIYHLPEIHQIDCVGLLGKPFLEHHVLYFDPEHHLIHYAEN